MTYEEYRENRRIEILVKFLTVVMLMGLVFCWYYNYKESTSFDYDIRFTEHAYVAITEDQNVNLVFYRQNCPYCQAGKNAVMTAAKQSAYPTFFIDVESEEGQVLVKKYSVKKAATIIQLRDGKAQSFFYGTVRDGRKTADHRQIETAFDIEEGD